MFSLPRLVGRILILLIPFAAHSAPAAGSRLASGRWVKLRVPSSGIYQVNDRSLADMGFTDPGKVSVDGLPFVRYGGKLIFYCEGPISVGLAADGAPVVTADPCSPYGYCLLSDSGDAASGLVSVPFPGDADTVVASHRHVEVVYPGEVCYADMGSRRFGQPFQSRSEASYSFGEVMSADSIADVALHISWLTDVPGTLYALLRGKGCTVTGSEGMEALSVRKPSLRQSEVRCRLRHGSVPEFDLTFSDVANKGFTAVGHTVLTYGVANSLGGRQQTVMHLPDADSRMAVEVPGAVEVWDVTPGAAARRLEVVGGRVMPAVSGSVRLVAFDPAAELPEPEMCGQVAPQDLLAGAGEADMLVVACTGLLEEACGLASLHRCLQHLNVIVATDRQIYNEYSSGRPCAEAIREYARSVYLASGRRLRYLLLYGDGSYDNWHALDGGFALPTYQCRSDRYMFDSGRSYCSDAFFGMMDSVVDHEQMFFGEVALGVGRITASSPTEARDVNRKIERRLSRPADVASLARTGVVLCDAGDGGLHLRTAEELAAQFAGGDADAVVHKVYTDLTRWSGGLAVAAKSDYLRHLRAGCGFVHYAGHGTEYSITGQDLWSVADVGSSAGPVPPVVFHSSCLNGRFDGDRRSLAEAMLASPGGGASACIMASRDTDASHNRRLHLEFIRLASAAPSGSRLGDLWLDAQNSVVGAAREVGHSPLAVNVRHFNLIGDPALPLYSPALKVVAELDSCGSSSTGLDFSLGGQIENAGGVARGFEGKVRAEAFLTGVERVTLGQDGSAPGAVRVSVDDIPGWTGEAEVSGGRFAMSVSLPGSLRGGTYRLVFSATDGHDAASGAICGLGVDPESMRADSVAPLISRLAVDGERCGGMVVSPRAVVAEVSDSGSGLCSVGHAPGEGCRLMIDGRWVTVGVECVSQMSADLWRVEYPLPAMSDGRHSLTLSVSDNAGNRASRSVDFTLLRREASAVLEADRRDVRGEAAFTWTHDLGRDAEVVLLVRDINGRTVCRRQFDGGEEGYIWNLCGADGVSVASGPYDCHLLATDGRCYASSAALRIIVLH